MKKVCILVALLISLVFTSYEQQPTKENQYQFVLPQRLAYNLILLLQGQDDKVSVKDNKEIVTTFINWYSIQYNYYDSISKIKKDTINIRKDSIPNIKKPIRK